MQSLSLEKAGLPVNSAICRFPFSRSVFCDGIYGAVIVKTEEIHIHVVGGAVPENGGNSEVSDAVYKKSVFCG